MFNYGCKGGQLSTLMLCIMSDSFSCQGIILSGGQRQRISVARALYQTTNVVFLVSLNTILLTPRALDAVLSYLLLIILNTIMCQFYF